MTLPRDTDDFPNRFAVSTRGLQRVATLPALLNDAVLTRSQHPTPEIVDGVLAWGHRPSAVKAERLARKFDLLLLRAEDGFLRSF